MYLVFAYVYMVESRTEAYVYLMKFPENVGNKLLKEKKKNILYLSLQAYGKS